MGLLLIRFQVSFKQSTALSDSLLSKIDSLLLVFIAQAFQPSSQEGDSLELAHFEQGANNYLMFSTFLLAEAAPKQHHGVLAS